MIPSSACTLLPLIPPDFNNPAVLLQSNGRRGPHSGLAKELKTVEGGKIGFKLYVGSVCQAHAGALEEEAVQLMDELDAATTAGDAVAALHAVAARARGCPPEMWRRHDVMVRSELYM